MNLLALLHTATVALLCIPLAAQAGEFKAGAAQVEISIGYVPNREAYPHGNYEVVSARCAEGSGEKLAEAAIASLQTLAKQP